MLKRVLVLHYSQSGQLTDIVNNISKPLEQSDEISIDYCELEMEEPYPFPWNKENFFGVFPDTFLQVPKKIKPIPAHILSEKYDVVILGYPVWYLTPAQPITSFLKSAYASQLLENTSVITVIGCRNMWIMAQEKLKKQLQQLNANLVGNIALVDRHINHISVITIVHWMFTGKKTKKWGLFPKPGVSQKDIDESVKFGDAIKTHLLQKKLSTLQPSLVKLGAVKIKPFLVTVDKRANVMFTKWAHIITAKSTKNTAKRSRLLKLFNYYLIIAIWILAPIVFVLFLLTYLININKITKDKAYYQSVAIKD